MNDQILAELITIRQLLERAIAAPPAARPAAPAPTGQVAIPQPSQLVAEPGAVCVHFGKNDGQPLSSLNDRSIEWYATPKEPRLNKQGQPFPPRPADEQLANAARQLYHAKRGTLVGSVPAAQATFVAGGTAPDIDENVPF
jgi:hypothetical protein